MVIYSVNKRIDFLWRVAGGEINEPPGKTVEITVRESPDPVRPNRWQALIDIAGRDLIDPEVYTQQRLLETKVAER